MSYGRADLGRAEWALRLLGLAVWAFVGIERLYVAPAGPWLFAWVAFGTAFCLTGLRRIPVPARAGLLGLQTVALLLLPGLGLPGFEGLTASVVAAQAPTVLSFRRSWLWAAAQAALLLALVAPSHGARSTLEILGAYSTFTAFALMAYGLHHRLARINAELLATRALLAQSARVSERLRISRELHDTLGHHLTALSIQLDLASRIADGAAGEVVRESHALARTMLTEVRGVVSAMREDGEVDLAEALRSLPQAFSEPVIHCEVAAELPRVDAVRAHALFRCAQEALTNAARHSGAHNVWLEVSRRDGALHLVARDDGQGVERVAPGRGLTGMRERLTELGGALDLTSSKGGGFQVHAWLPLAGTPP